MIYLEQFNEGVRKEFKEEFGEMIEAVRFETGVHYLIPDWITKKLTEHKELILKVVREVVPKIKITGEGTYCQTCRQHKAAGECDCIGFNKGVQEFLNNLDTV